MNTVALNTPHTHPTIVPGWPDDAINLAALHAGGWRPTPLREFVLKVHQRCNISCDYCYVYTMADQSWRDRPAVMSAEIWEASAVRIANHVVTHKISEVTIILHGGEPLLAGTDLLAQIAATMRETVSSATHVRVALQTNGVLLNEHRLAELSKHNIRVAVSIDGGAAAQDLHRRHADGRSSYAEVQRGLRLLSSERYRSIFAGLLCVIDPKVDPLASYRALMAFGPPSIDVLLPHANWETGAPSGTFGPWLVRLFDEYFDQPKKQTTIRLFDEIINLQLGGSSWSEHVGLSPAAVAVIETDGAIEQTDALKSAFPGAAATGLSVLTDSFDAALRHPGVIARQIGQKALCTTCQECGIRDICGGGHYAHRFRPGSGFLNPSVYCDDMQILIEHVGRRMQQSLGARLAMADRQAPPIG